jgi:hypothetical protein
MSLSLCSLEFRSVGFIFSKVPNPFAALRFFPSIDKS